jgi:hypothetical protein
MNIGTVEKGEKHADLGTTKLGQELEEGTLGGVFVSRLLINVDHRTPSTRTKHAEGIGAKTERVL